MEFLDKEQLKVRNAKHDRSIFLYTVIVLIPCFAMMVASFVLAYVPIAFKAQGGESGFTVSRIGFYNAYVDGTPRYSNFDFG